MSGHRDRRSPRGPWRVVRLDRPRPSEIEDALNLWSNLEGLEFAGLADDGQHVLLVLREGERSTITLKGAA